MACFRCNSDVLGYDYYYFVADLGPEISTILDQEIAHEIPINAVLCEVCFISVTSALDNTSNGPEAFQVTVKLETPHEGNVCVWCLLSLSQRRTHLLASGPQRDIISDRIAPREIPEGARVCHSCWTRACRLQGVAAANPSQTQNICVCCRRSLTLRRSCPIPYGPERDEISARIAPTQILPGNRVCYACWVTARRNVQRANNPNINEIRNTCIVCSISIIKRRTHLLSHSILRDVVSRRIYPRELNDKSLVCHECWTWAQDAVQQENETLHPELSHEEPQQFLNIVPSPSRYIQLDNYKKIGTSSANCFVPGCINSERHVVPTYLRKNILAKYKTYICEQARICLVHKNTYDWDHELNTDLLSNVFSVEEIEKMLQINN